MAIYNGLLTSIIIETFILGLQMARPLALRKALGMSLLSMIAMEAAMNITDYLLTGGVILTWWVLFNYLVRGVCDTPSL